MENQQESEDGSHHSGTQCGQLSVASHHLQHPLRSRNNSDTTNDSNNQFGESGSSSSCFFADMTLDLSEAQMESTPRTDMKFAALASREMAQSVPPMPLIEEPIDSNNGENVVASYTVSSAAEGEASGFASLSEKNTNSESNSKFVAAATPKIPERSLARIESGALNNRSGHSLNNSSLAHFCARRTRPPRRPRDISWTAAALTLLPTGLLLPHVYYSTGYVHRHNHHPCSISSDSNSGSVNESYNGCHPHHTSWSQTVLSPSSHSVILFSSLFATAASFVLLRLLYSYPGGGEGDDRRHVSVTRTLILSSNLCVWLNPLLTIFIWHWLPDCRAAASLPLGLMMRDGFRVKNSGSSLPSFGLRLDTLPRRGAGLNTGMARRSAPSANDRKTFFRALAVASLDILSRALRSKSFVRVSSAVLLLQLVTVSLWWGAVSAVLSVIIFEEDSITTEFMHTFWLMLSLVSGKWATGTVARLLGFIASGGVASWSYKQAMIIEVMEREQAAVAEAEAERWRQVQMEARQQPTPSKALEAPTQHGGDAVTEDSSNVDSMMSVDPASGYNPDYAAAGAAARVARHAMPEAYRAADAAAYASVMDFDEGLDGDYQEDARGHEWERGSAEFYFGTPTEQHLPSTVKSFLLAGCTISFGSVAQCGLLGGLAQFLWSVVRNVDAMGIFLQRRFSNSDSPLGFRGMDISVNDSGGGGSRQWKQALAYFWRKLDVLIRGFVRSHSDLAMSHIAAYFKSYQRAANDVAVLIETSGVESIIHDDITTHMCSSAGHLVAGSIVMVFGMLLVAYRNSFNSDPLADTSLLEVLVFSYVLCYTILSTVLEPLRAAIKAVYLCFAEHPSSLRRAFPLIYQRLSRISDASQY